MSLRHRRRARPIVALPCCNQPSAKRASRSRQASVGGVLLGCRVSPGLTQVRLQGIDSTGAGIPLDCSPRVFSLRPRRVRRSAVGGRQAGEQSPVPAASCMIWPDPRAARAAPAAVNAPGKDGSVLRGTWSRSSTACERRVRAACGHAVHADRLICA